MSTEMEDLRTAIVKQMDELTQRVKDEHERAERLGTNCRWHIDQIDKIHRRLCPNQNGTWQDRVSQAVIAAERAHDSPTIQCYRAPEGQGRVRYIKTRGTVTDAIGSEGVANPVEIAQNMVSIGTGTYWTPCTLEEYQKAEDEKAAGK